MLPRVVCLTTPPVPAVVVVVAGSRGEPAADLRGISITSVAAGSAGWDAGVAAATWSLFDGDPSQLNPSSDNDNDHSNNVYYYYYHYDYNSHPGHLNLTLSPDNNNNNNNYYYQYYYYYYCCYYCYYRYHYYNQNSHSDR